MEAIIGAGSTDDARETSVPISVLQRLIFLVLSEIRVERSSIWLRMASLLLRGGFDNGGVTVCLFASCSGRFWESLSANRSLRDLLGTGVIGEGIFLELQYHTVGYS